MELFKKIFSEIPSEINYLFEESLSYLNRRKLVPVAIEMRLKRAVIRHFYEQETQKSLESESYLLYREKIFNPDEDHSKDFQEFICQRSNFFQGETTTAIGIGIGGDILYALRLGAKWVTATEPIHIYYVIALWNRQFAVDTQQVPTRPVEITCGSGFPSQVGNRIIFNTPAIRNKFDIEGSKERGDSEIYTKTLFISERDFMDLFEKLKEKLNLGAKAIWRIMPIPILSRGWPEFENFPYSSKEEKYLDKSEFSIFLNSEYFDEADLGLICTLRGFWRVEKFLQRMGIDGEANPKIKKVKIVEKQGNNKYYEIVTSPEKAHPTGIFMLQSNLLPNKKTSDRLPEIKKISNSIHKGIKRLITSL